MLQSCSIIPRFKHGFNTEDVYILQAICFLMCVWLQHKLFTQRACYIITSPGERVSNRIAPGIEMLPAHCFQRGLLDFATSLCVFLQWIHLNANPASHEKSSLTTRTDKTPKSSVTNGSVFDRQAGGAPSEMSLETRLNSWSHSWDGTLFKL